MFSKLFEDFNSWKRNTPQSFVLTSLCHANENAHTRILMALLQYTDAHGRNPFCESFLNDVIGVETEGVISDVYITNQRATMGLKDGSKGYIDLFITFHQGDGEYFVIVENKIHGATDTEDQLNRYVYDNVEHGELDLEHFKKFGGFCKESIYLVYLTRDGNKKPGGNSLSEVVSKTLDNHFVEISYADEILRWLYDALDQLSQGTDEIMIAGVRQYITGIEDLLGMNPRKWMNYADLRSEFVHLSDVEFWKVLDKPTFNASDEEFADEFKTYLKNLRRCVFTADAPEGWTLHVTPSFTCLYPESWKKSEKCKTSIPSLFFMTNTNSLLSGKGENIKWKLMLTHLPKDWEASQSFPARMNRAIRNNYANGVQDIEFYVSYGKNHGRDAVIGAEQSLSFNFDINDAKSRCGYYENLVSVLSPYIEFINSVL